MENETIDHVSDTALWVAGYRAQETDRKDALFNDTLARKLAGERGAKILASMPYSKIMAFVLAIRTVAIDRLVEMAIARGVDTVINLGAGLDTRPYRMKLPADLRWIEVDFEHMVNYKNEQLRSERSVCRLERIAADLSQDDERKKLLARLGAETKKAVVITEGVIPYLTNEQAAKLSNDLFSIPTFQYWIQDYRQGKLRRNRVQKKISEKLKNAPWLFRSDDPIHFFGRDGWKAVEDIHMLDEADRVKRRLPISFPWNLLYLLFPKKTREMANKAYGYIMFGRP